MTSEEIFDREETRLMEEIRTMPNSEHVLSVVEELKLVWEGQSIAREVKALKEDYRQAKEGLPHV